MMSLAAFALAGCLAMGAGSDHILAKDLAPAFPALADVAPDTPLALAPFPGVPRIFRVPELRSMSVRLNAAPTPENDICVQRPVALLDSTRILEAMRRELPAARIEILEFSRQPAPEGALEFPVTGLRSSYWNGFVRYGVNRRFPVWAKVKVAKDIVRGETVQVEVINGGAHLEFEARAEASGSTGDTIPVLNPLSKKSFRARVEGKGRVSVKSL